MPDESRPTRLVISRKIGQALLISVDGAEILLSLIDRQGDWIKVALVADASVKFLRMEALEKDGPSVSSDTKSRGSDQADDASG